jgi:lipopolysaccharide/colanic/teichoic acid biosynthesis glycosyltransferase
VAECVTRFPASSLTLLPSGIVGTQGEVFEFVMADAGSFTSVNEVPAHNTRRQHLAAHAVARLGDVLVERGLVSRGDLQQALAEQAKEACLGHWVLLGELLEEWGLATPAQVDAALALEIASNEPMQFERIAHPSVNSRLKRWIDVVGALMGLGLTGALLPAIALAIHLEDRGPIFFQQQRVGRHGWQFPIWKFRTMVPNADHLKASVANHNPLFFKPESNDPRITRVGRVLRQTMLDELPQFWNVLRGEMSLVGTRPPTLDEVTHYQPCHFHRLEVKPGLTGLWQVSGDRHGKGFDDVVALDLEYQRRWSIALDVSIVLRTVMRVVGLGPKL